MRKYGRYGRRCLVLTMLALVAAPGARVRAQGGKVYAWARLYAATSVARNRAVTESAYYTSINLVDAAGAEQAKQLATAYFNQKIVPYFAEDRQLRLREVQVKTFATLEQADDARYAAFEKDQQTLNPNDRNGFPSTGFFNCALAEGAPRAAWMADAGEVSVSAVPAWRYFYAPVQLVRQSDQEDIEQRLYFSEPFEVYIEDSNRWLKIFGKYFGAVVDEPLRKKIGVEVQWTDEEIELEPTYIRNDTGNTYREARAALNQLIADRASYEQPMLTFNFADRGALNGEATGNVRCFKYCERATVALTAAAKNK